MRKKKKVELKRRQPWKSWAKNTLGLD